MASDFVEYVFIDPRGDENYESVGERSDILAFADMHKAKVFMPVTRWDALSDKMRARARGRARGPVAKAARS